MNTEKEEWDDNKASSNKKKHDDLSFDEALEVFDDPFYLEKFDIENSSAEEDRYQVLGRIKNQLVVVVVYTPRNGKTRIISARYALSHERKVYYDRIKRIANNC